MQILLFEDLGRSFLLLCEGTTIALVVREGMVISPKEGC